MRKYRSTSGIERTAVMEIRPTSYGPYIGSHVLVSTESALGTAYGRFGSFEEGFAWLVANFGQGWVRVRYQD